MIEKGKHFSLSPCCCWFYSCKERFYEEKAVTVFSFCKKAITCQALVALVNSIIKLRGIDRLSVCFD